MKTTFFIVDDDEPFRKTLISHLNDNPNYHVIGEASNGLEVLNSKTVVTADIVVMNIMMKQFHGLDVARKLLGMSPQMKILAVTNFAGAVFLQHIMNAGLYGCILKSYLFDEFSEAVECLLKEKHYFSTVIPI